MTTDWEAAGLLKGTRGRAREERRRLLDELAADGASIEGLRTAVAEDRLALRPLERVLEGEGRRYTVTEVAEMSGLETRPRAGPHDGSAQGQRLRRCRPDRAASR